MGIRVGLVLHVPVRVTSVPAVGALAGAYLGNGGYRYILALLRTAAARPPEDSCHAPSAFAHMVTKHATGRPQLRQSLGSSFGTDTATYFIGLVRGSFPFHKHASGWLARGPFGPCLKTPVDPTWTLPSWWATGAWRLPHVENLVESKDISGDTRVRCDPLATSRITPFPLRA